MSLAGLTVNEVKYIGVAQVEIINFSPAVKITNLDQLPRGTGARYLEVMLDAMNIAAPWIAVQWRRKLPTAVASGRAIIDFKPVGPSVPVSDRNMTAIKKRAAKPTKPCDFCAKIAVKDGDTCPVCKANTLPRNEPESSSPVTDKLLATPAPKKARKVAGTSVAKSAPVQPASVAKRASDVQCSGCQVVLNKRVVKRGFTQCQSCRKGAPATAPVAAPKPASKAKSPAPKKTASSK